MMVNCNVGYYDDYGNLINNLQESREHYLRRWDGFMLDALSILPVELVLLFIAGDAVDYLVLIHMLRLIHIKRYFKQLQSKITVK